jgi:uncharacterized protein YbjT (DUF2867 family)
LAQGRFAVRALTRNSDSEKAASLREAGAEVVQGDLSDIESLHAALRGSHGVFGVTNFWEHFDKEYELGKNLIDAVAASDVRHLVFSTLPHVKTITEGELEVPHFDTKGRLEEYARDRGLPATFIHVAFYFENFLSFFPPQKNSNGGYAFGFPQGDTPLAGVSVEDVGGVVAAIFANPKKFKGRVVGVVGDDLTGEDYAAIMSRVLGKTVTYNYIPRDVFASFDFPGAEDLANMFEYNRLYIPNRCADVSESRSLYSEMQNFTAWLMANEQKFEHVLGE